MSDSAEWINAGAAIASAVAAGFSAFAAFRAVLVSRLASEQARRSEHAALVRDLMSTVHSVRVG